MQYITITDYLLLPIYLFIVFIIAIYYRNKHYRQKNPLRKYFLWAFGLKIFGGIFVGLIYHYYYKGGDTFNYWNHTLVINSSLQDSFFTWLKLVTSSADRYDTDIFPYTSLMQWYDSPQDYFVPSVGAVIGLFTLTTYLPTTMIYAALSFAGVWKLFVVFTKLYPGLIKQMAISFLFIPSVVFWGSGFMKDTITFSCIGWITYFFYLIFFENKKIVANSIAAIFFLYVIYKIKPYIVLAFLPAVLLWGIGLLSHKIQNKRLIITARYFLYASAIGGLIAIGGRLQEKELFGQYKLQDLAFKSFATRDYLYRVSTEQEGSAYSLGEVEQSLTGMLKKTPAAINVTLFRPYVWEARKPIVILSALEALFFLGFTIVVLFRNNPLRFMQKIFSDETLQFCIIFTLIFAFAVGISTSNFGSLSRYKIPCMPFYAAFLFILYNSFKKTKTPNPV
jgi:hypothetical protein